MKGVGKQTDYAARVVVHLASLDGSVPVPVRAIAERRLLPAPFVRRVVARLAAAGILRTTRGAGGGVRLARPPAAISMLDVVLAMEGELVLNRCASSKNECPLGEICPVQRAWVLATRRAEEQLRSVTFAQLADAHERMISAQGYPQRAVRASARRRRKR